MKIAKGMETYSCFFLGHDPQFTERIFDLLQGDTDISERSVISMDLNKRESGIAYPVAIKHYNWEHLANNTKMITKEMFKELNLEQNPDL